MPKKKGENTKSRDARERKEQIAEQKATEKQRSIADNYWRDDDKFVVRKQQRKTEKEDKRLAVLNNKSELKKLEDEEDQYMYTKHNTGKIPSVPKLTQAEITSTLDSGHILTGNNNNNNNSNNNSNKTSGGATPNIVTDKPLEENINHTYNRLTDDDIACRTIEQAITVLNCTAQSQSAPQMTYSKFEKDNLQRLQRDNPTLRLSQVKQMLKKEWQRAPENPINQL